MIDTSQWKFFNLTGEDGIFRIESCKCSNAGELLEDGTDIEYIGAKKDDNGVMSLVKYNENLVTKGNCIIFICDGQGSIGYANYIDHDFIGSTTLSVGYNSHLNEKTGYSLLQFLIWNAIDILSGVSTNPIYQKRKSSYQQLPPENLIGITWKDILTL